MRGWQGWAAGGAGRCACAGVGWGGAGRSVVRGLGLLRRLRWWGRVVPGWPGCGGAGVPRVSSPARQGGPAEPEVSAVPAGPGSSG